MEFFGGAWNPLNWDWSGEKKTKELQEKVNKDAAKAGVKPNETAPQYIYRNEIKEPLNNQNWMLIAAGILLVVLVLKD